MKKSVIKITVALGIILGGLVPFSHVIGFDDVAKACGMDDKSGESSDDKGSDT